jgi:hypothetical protein
MEKTHTLRTMTLASTLLATALAALTLPACKKDVARGASATAPSSGAPATVPAADAAQEAEGAKLHAAIECLNWLSANVFEIRDRYLAGVDPKTGASGKAKPVMMGLRSIDPCVRDVKKAGAIKPGVAALDAASAAYVSALEGFEKPYEEIKGYYAKDEHLDDKGKKAQELHPRFMAAFKTFSAAHKELSATVRTLNRKRRETRLAAREKAEGRNLAVIMDTMMLEAETLVDLATSDQIELATLDAQIASTGKLVDEVDAYASAHKDEVSQFGSMGNIKNYDKSFLAASKTVARKLRDKGKPTDSDYENVSTQYNSLVTNYNNH